MPSSPYAINPGAGSATSTSRSPTSTTGDSLARALRRLRACDVELTGARDHGASESLYLRDPDGRLALLNEPLDPEALLVEEGPAPV